MLSDQPAANRISFNAAEHDNLIESATVFQYNRAEIRRRVNLDLKKGQNHVRIEQLPSVIIEDSIRVDGTGAAFIFDVVYHAPSRDQGHVANTSASAELRRALEALQKERSIAQEQSDFLGNYGRTLDSKSVNIEDVQRFLDMFGPRQFAVSKRIRELDIQIEKAQAELNKAQRKENAESRRAQRRTAITVTILAETDGSAELALTYVVYSASWKPLYDVRASIGTTPEGASTMALHYRASITQTTGENWPDVALTLSTASPLLGTSVPQLSPWRIGFPAPSPPIPMSRAVPRSAAMEGARGALAPLQPASVMTTRQARVESTGVLNTTFSIPGRSEIPSDQDSHKVVIAVLKLQANLEWVCVPRKKEMQSHKLERLPGEANVFVDNNFVSKSQIEHVSPNESFKTSLGVDSALRVTYPAPKTLNRTMTQSGFLFMAREEQSVSAQSQKIVIRNTRPTPVSVRVLDHVPVSTDACISVNIISPVGLGIVNTSNEGTGEGDKKESPWKDVQKGVKARWALLETGGEGTVEWSCNIAPSNEAELELAWEVSAPSGQQWENL